MRSFGLILLLVLAACAQQPRPIPAAITAADVGPPMSGKRAELFQPQGAGPFPAMVLLHGCDGVGPHDRFWAQTLADWGYAALLVDSFHPRGIDSVCNRGMIVPPQLQAADAFAGAEYLRHEPQIAPERIGVIGFSHGGWAVLKAVLADTPSANHAPPFTAAIAFYPGCDPPGEPVVTDTLILIGAKDEWTPAARCAVWVKEAAPNGHVVAMKIYPDALHAFDALIPPHEFAGHHIGRNPAAADAAMTETRAFLAERLTR